MALYRSVETFFGAHLGGRVAPAGRPETARRIASITVNVDTLRPARRPAAGGEGAPGAADVRGAAPPHLVLLGGKVFTADSTHPWAEAVATRGDRIVALGATNAVAALAGPGTRRIDLGGRVVVPGFNDAHIHLGGVAPGTRVSDSALTAGGAGFMPRTPPAAVLAAVSAVARTAPPGDWLFGTVDPALIAAAPGLRDALDRAAAGHPLLLRAPTGHGAVLNTAALRAGGVDDRTADPTRGAYERDAAGRLTGVAQEYAVWRLWSAGPAVRGRRHGGLHERSLRVGQVARVRRSGAGPRHSAPPPRPRREPRAAAEPLSPHPLSPTRAAQGGS